MIEDAGVGQLVFGLVAAARGVARDEFRIGEGRVRVAVDHAVVGVRRQRIGVMVDFLDVLAVVALAIAEAEQAFLEEGVVAVPQGKAEAPAHAGIAEPGQAVLAPAIGAAQRVGMREERPGVAVVAVVLADRAPLALAEIRPPAPPRDPRVDLAEATAFRGLK